MRRVNKKDKHFKLRNQRVRITQNTTQATICKNKSGGNILKPIFSKRIVYYDTIGPKVESPCVLGYDGEAKPSFIYL